jgi:hypothetical protein
MNELQRLSKTPSEEDARDDLFEAARLAFIYGFPCYEMARLRYRALTEAGTPARPNSFRHGRRLILPATNRTSGNNVDTLYSGAWLDLSQGPLVIDMPKLEGRYYSLQLMDFFTNNFAVLGPQMIQSDGHPFLLVGPGWKGTAPDGMTLLRSPTNAVWGTLRILVDDPDDLTAARALQDRFNISTPPGPVCEPARGCDARSLPVLPLDQTDVLTFFDILNAVLTENPPPEQDKDVLGRLRLINVGPALKFARGDFTPAQLDALKKGIAAGRESIRVPLYATRGGWSRPPADLGVFGTNYAWRARCALIGIGALPRQEAMYFTTFCDASGAPLHGGNRYLICFETGGLPPVEAFWSLTVYRRDKQKRRWLVRNAINRYSVGDRTPHLRYGADGSLQIFIQHIRPMVNQENWLPAPQGPFLLTLRAYRPRRDLLDGKYIIPLPTLRAPPRKIS